VIDCLQRNVPTAKIDETIGEVLSRLKGSKLRMLPVVNDRNVLLGLITDRPSQNVDLNASVSETMNSGPTTLRPYTAVEDAIKKLDKQTHAIPVTSSDGTLMGVFSG
jgi:CBS-domain-containing membrane protein